MGQRLATADSVVAMHSHNRPRLAVYCGSRDGDDPAFVEAASQMGSLIAASGCDVVYGGGSTGLMGAVADAAVAGGAHVLGVMPELFTEVEIAHETISELHIVQDMTVRKRMMLDTADATLTLPGGIGTFEEFIEVLSWASLRIHDKPIGLLNVKGYYDQLLEFLDHSVLSGLSKPAVRDLIVTSPDPAEVLQQLLDRISANAR